MQVPGILNSDARLFAAICDISRLTVCINDSITIIKSHNHQAEEKGEVDKPLYFYPSSIQLFYDLLDLPIKSCLLKTNTPHLHLSQPWVET